MDTSGTTRSSWRSTSPTWTASIGRRSGHPCWSGSPSTRMADGYLDVYRRALGDQGRQVPPPPRMKEQRHERRRYADHHRSTRQRSAAEASERALRPPGPRSTARRPSEPEWPPSERARSSPTSPATWRRRCRQNAPAVIDASRSRAGFAAREVRAASSENLMLGTVFSTGLALGLLLARAPRLLVIAALVPVFVMGSTLIEPPGRWRSAARKPPRAPAPAGRRLAADQTAVSGGYLAGGVGASSRPRPASRPPVPCSRR